LLLRSFSINYSRCGRFGQPAGQGMDWRLRG
jgi:hypothetical protein